MSFAACTFYTTIPAPTHLDAHTSPRKSVHSNNMSQLATLLLSVGYCELIIVMLYSISQDCSDMPCMLSPSSNVAVSVLTQSITLLSVSSVVLWRQLGFSWPVTMLDSALLAAIALLVHNTTTFWFRIVYLMFFIVRFLITCYVAPNSSQHECLLVIRVVCMLVGIGSDCETLWNICSRTALPIQWSADVILLANISILLMLWVYQISLFAPPDRYYTTFSVCSMSTAYFTSSCALMFVIVLDSVRGGHFVALLFVVAMFDIAMATHSYHTSTKLEEARRPRATLPSMLLLFPTLLVALPLIS